MKRQTSSPFASINDPAAFNGRLQPPEIEFSDNPMATPTRLRVTKPHKDVVTTLLTDVQTDKPFIPSRGGINLTESQLRQHQFHQTIKRSLMTPEKNSKKSSPAGGDLKNSMISPASTAMALPKVTPPRQPLSGPPPIKIKPAEPDYDDSLQQAIRASLASFQEEKMLREVGGFGQEEEKIEHSPVIIEDDDVIEQPQPRNPMNEGSLSVMEIEARDVSPLPQRHDHLAVPSQNDGQESQFSIQYGDLSEEFMQQLQRSTR
jgi:hypothetical protein